MSTSLGLSILLDGREWNGNWTGEPEISKESQDKIAVLGLSSYLKSKDSKTFETEEIEKGEATATLEGRLIDLSRELKKPILGFSTRDQKAKALEYLLLFSIYVPNHFAMRKNPRACMDSEGIEAFKRGSETISRLFKLVEMNKITKPTKADRLLYTRSVEIISGGIREAYTKHLSPAAEQTFVPQVERALDILNSKTL